MITIVNLRTEFDKLAMLKGRTPTTTDAEKDGAIARLAPYRDGAVFASKFSGTSDWERHGQGDEIVQIVDGATTLHLMTEDGPRFFALAAGMMAIVPQETWHRFEGARWRVLDDGDAAADRPRRDRCRGSSDDPVKAAMQQIFQINAFSADSFSGNPAIVCPLQHWLDTELMQKIAAENGRTCAFFVGADGRYELRWFTPRTEIEGICGHGTLAAGFVILNEFDDKSDEIVFHVPAGELRVRRSNGGYVLDLPVLNPTPRPLPENIAEILGREPEALLGALDLLAVFSAEEHVADFKPNAKSLRDLPLRAVIVTAPGIEVDFVSRWFAPKQGEGEDTGLTGSAHCSLVPYWANRLEKTQLRARQLSPRGATVDCELNGDRVWLSCMAAKYMHGNMYL